jgi:diguanylate cyclase (GGDEF)-like protein
VNEVGRDASAAVWAEGKGASPAVVVDLVGAQAAERVSFVYPQLARGLLDALDASTCAVDAQGIIIAVNAAWRAFSAHNGGNERRTGLGVDYQAACAVPGDSADAHDAAKVAEGLRGVMAGGTARFQHDYPCHSPQEHRWFSVRVAPLDLQGGRGAVLSHVDVTQLHDVQEALAHQSLHDALTGLPNRLLLNDRLSQALADARRLHLTVGVGFLDLDHFKRINDTLGHAAGDDLLVQVAKRLRRQLRNGDTAARLAGDEFVVVWRNLATQDDAAGLRSRLTEALAPPFTLGGTEIAVSISIGVALSQHEQTGPELLVAADTVMYEAKRQSRVQPRPSDAVPGSGLPVRHQVTSTVPDASGLGRS